jgi:glycosyltransferase involved in cell wall biosynthesis
MQKETGNSPKQSGSIRVTVVIPTRNEERVLGKCLESLANNVLPKTEFEVIVVDNGSQDHTMEVAKSFEPKLSIRVLSLSGVHISALRNHGAAMARGELFAFLDADCLAPADWLLNASRILQDVHSGIVGAHYQIPNDSTWVGRIWSEDRSAEKIGAVSYVPAGDLLLRREVFAKIGGFEESIQTNEDLELCQRALAAGFTVKSFPELRVVHLGTPRTLLGFYRKQRWHGTHVFAVFLRDPKKRKNRKPVALALFTITCFVLLIAGFLWGLKSGHWSLLLVSGLLYITPLLLLSSSRTWPRGKWQEMFPLMLLYATYGLARAEAILRVRNWWSAYRSTATPGAKLTGISTKTPG